MGTWGSGSFENDDAADFAYAFERDGLSALDAALKGAAADYLEAPEAQRAIAAAELVAAAMGRPAALPAEIDVEANPFIKRMVSGLGDLRMMAIAAVDRVLADKSELKELWEEDDASAWLAAVNDLRHRLAD